MNKFLLSRLCMDGEEHVWNSPGGWTQTCHFFYHTSHHQRFYEGEMLDFSYPAKNAAKKKRVARRELVKDGIGGRLSMVQRGAGSIRTKYHNVPVELPPPPSDSSNHNNIINEHSYANPT